MLAPQQKDRVGWRDGFTSSGAVGSTCPYSASATKTIETGSCSFARASALQVFGVTPDSLRDASLPPPAKPYCVIAPFSTKPKMTYLMLPDQNRLSTTQSIGRVLLKSKPPIRFCASHFGAVG